MSIWAAASTNPRNVVLSPEQKREMYFRNISTISTKATRQEDALKAFLNFDDPPSSKQSITFKNITDNFRDAYIHATSGTVDETSKTFEEVMDNFESALLPLVSRTSKGIDLKNDINFKNFVAFVKTKFAQPRIPTQPAQAPQIARQSASLQLNPSRSTIDTPSTLTPSLTNSTSQKREQTPTKTQTATTSSNSLKASYISPTSTPIQKSFTPLFEGLKRVESLDPEKTVLLGSLYKSIHGSYMQETDVDLQYIEYMDIWKPFMTYNAIFIMKGNTNWDGPTIDRYKAIHFLHHFRVCLDILHMIYFRLDPTLQQYTYARNLKATGPFSKDTPLFTYVGWDMLKVLNKNGLNKVGIKLLNFVWGTQFSGQSGVQNRYKQFYAHIDDVFKTNNLSDNQIDTFIEVVCLIFSVNYKLSKFQGQLTNTSDRYHYTQILNTIPGVIGGLMGLDKGSEPPCYIKDEDIIYLRQIYEKHCILIVTTLILCGVSSFHVPFPPNDIKTQLTKK